MRTLFIIRHGHSEPLQANDHLRQLTDIGRSQAQDVGQFLKAQAHGKVGLITSPYVRTMQSADIIKAQLEGVDFEQVSDDFVPSAEPQVAADYIQALMNLHQDIDTWLVVSHMPFVSYFVAQFCADKMPIFDTCSVAQLSVPLEGSVGQWQHMIDVCKR